MDSVDWQMVFLLCFQAAVKRGETPLLRLFFRKASELAPSAPVYEGKSGSIVGLLRSCGGTERLHDGLLNSAWFIVNPAQANSSSKFLFIPLQTKPQIPLAVPELFRCEFSRMPGSVFPKGFPQSKHRIKNNV